MMSDIRITTQCTNTCLFGKLAATGDFEDEFDGDDVDAQEQERGKEMRCKPDPRRDGTPDGGLSKSFLTV